MAKIIERLNFGEKFEALHFHEIKVVEFLQHNYMDQKDFLQFISHLGGPNISFLLYFPVAYFLSHAVGLKILWAAVFSEWFNATLKWLLFGHRPYWWVRETTLYNNQNRPDIDQFPSTCETGPGSPSGHMMVTAAVWYVIVKATINHLRSSREIAGRELPFIADLILWYFFLIFLGLIGIGRMFIATHFPNQVVLGCLVGIFIGHVVSELPVHTFTLLNYLTGSMFLLQAVFYQYFAMFMMGLGPDWSIALATKWCADRTWVHLNTTPFYSLSRDIGSLFFTGLAQHYIGRKVDASSRGFIGTSMLIITGIAVIHVLDMLKLPTLYKFLFYVSGAIKEGMVPVIVIGMNTLHDSIYGKVKIN